MGTTQKHGPPKTSVPHFFLYIIPSCRKEVNNSEGANGRRITGIFYKKRKKQPHPTESLAQLLLQAILLFRRCAAPPVTGLYHLFISGFMSQTGETYD